MFIIKISWVSLTIAISNDDRISIGIEVVICKESNSLQKIYKIIIPQNYKLARNTRSVNSQVHMEGLKSLGCLTRKFPGIPGLLVEFVDILELKKEQNWQNWEVVQFLVMSSCILHLADFNLVLKAIDIHNL